MTKGDYSHIRQLIRTVPDFPKPGIRFYDISTLLQDPAGLHNAIQAFEDLAQGLAFDTIACIESRGFIFGSVLAFHMKKGLVMVRKRGKLPGKTLQASYDLEYGKATIEICEGSIKPGQKVLLVDDVLATGGTARAACDLLLQAGGIVTGCIFLLELEVLAGRDKLAPNQARSILTV